MHYITSHCNIINNLHIILLISAIYLILFNLTLLLSNDLMWYWYFNLGEAPCSQGSIRLQGGTKTSGLVEVCHIIIWGAVCANYYWGLTDAIVACRQLGFPATGAISLPVSDVPDGTRVGWLRNVRCVGTESSLFNCNNIRPPDAKYYSPPRYAGVSCQESKSYIF